MLLQIVHSTGNQEELNSVFHDKKDYIEFISDLQSKIKLAYESGF